MDYLMLLFQLVPIFYIHQKYNYWAKRGVSGPKPNIFKFGNLFQISGQDPLKIELELLAKHGKVYGIYTGLSPTLTIADAELIKHVFIKDFALFSNRRKLNAYHEMTSNNLLFSDVDQWKRLRTISSPTFSSAKLRKNVAIMNFCIDKFANYLDKLTSTGDGIIRDAKDSIIGLTIEVIAATSFGAQTNSNEDRTKENPYVVNALKGSDVNPLRTLSYFTMPRWFNSLVGIEHVFNVETVEFFRNSVRKIINQRKQSIRDCVTKQNDLIQLLLDSKANEDEVKNASFDELTASMDQDFTKGSKSDARNLSLNDSEILGVATGIFFAGFDTTAHTLSCCIYELSLHPEIQERLCDLLNDSLDGLDVNSDDYLDTVMNRIPYLDAVIKETLRKYPALVRLERRLTVDKHKLVGIELTKDQIVEISTLAVHYNAEYYPEPDQFQPDRFMPSNKHNLVPYTFLPFGDGPRNCMGMRYAYQEMKLFLSQILRNYRFSPTRDTPKQLKFLPFKFGLSYEPISIKVEKRSK